MRSPTEIRAALRRMGEPRLDATEMIDLADEVRRGLRDNPAVDYRFFREVEDIVGKLLGNGLCQAVTGLWQPLPLRPGETYVLVASGGGAAAARMRIEPLAEPVLRRGVLAIDSADHFRRAREGLVAALLGAGCGSLEHLAAGHAIEVQWDRPEDAFIEGASLGLSCCVCLVSRWLGLAPSVAVAGTAIVRGDGSLAPIERLAEKLVAVRECWPHVRSVVVASEQDRPALDHGLEIVGARTVIEALEHFGLEPTPARLPITSPRELYRRLRAFQDEGAHDRGREGWLDLSRQAFYVARALPVGDPDQARAWSWAALFALHAGNAGAAFAYLGKVPDGQLAAMGPTERVALRIVRASAAIDRLVEGYDEEPAVEIAAEAVRDAASIKELQLRRELVGRAAGTLGRALVHAGRLAEAIPELEGAVTFHRENLPGEAPRSVIYLATALRLSGRPAEALVAVDGELADITRVRRDAPPQTELFLHLERGRCSLDLHRPSEARESFEVVRAAQEREADYPRLGATRGLARALRQLGSEGGDDLLEECLHVAAREDVGLVIRRVAALAAGEALLDIAAGRSVRRPEAELHGIWTQHFPGDASVTSRIAQITY